MPDSRKKKAKNARRKRLRIIQNRSDPDRNFVEDNSGRRNKRVPVCFGTDFPTNTSAEEHEAKLSLSKDTDGEPIGVLIEERKSEKLNYVSYGMISVIGRRRVMEDTVKVVPGGELSFFGVYDGHNGDRVSKESGVRLHQLMLGEMDGKLRVDGGGERKWEKVIKECFAKTDEEVNGGDGGGGVSGGTEESSTVVVGPGKAVGSAAVVLVGKEEVVVANCGGSRAVLCCGGVPIPSSLDHKPDGADEKERLETATGGIGDQHLKPNVIAEPKIEVNKRTELDEFLIIASDGLWDVVPNDFACDVVRKCLHGQTRETYAEVSNSAVAAAMLAELALARGSNDNISVIVVELKKSITCFEPF